MDYPGVYLNALASMRHGPIVVLQETPGSSTTYQPLESMLKIIFGPQYAHPTHTRPLLPPVHILHRTSTNPPHFNATTQTQKQTHTEPEYPPEPRNLEEITPPTQLEIETIPPPAAKRPKTSPCPQSPVLPGLCAATRTPEETPGRERRNQTQSGRNTETVRTQEPEQTPPGAKRPTAAEWDGMSRNQKRRWRQWHK